MGTVSKICHQNKMRWIFLSVAIVCASAIEQEDSEGTEVMGKKPELFSVFTSYTTTTISTETVCYFTTFATPYPCYRRKKRAFSSEAVDQVPQFQPSQVESGLADSNLHLHDDNLHQNMDRRKRFLHSPWGYTL